MVNETAAIAEERIDSSVQTPPPPPQLQVSSSDRRAAAVAVDRLAVSLDERCLLPRSADNLSWKFFEEVSSLDRQLRGEEKSAILTDDCHLMSTAATAAATTAATHDGAAALAASAERCETNSGKTNGIAVRAALTDDVLPQPSPDLITHSYSPHSSAREGQSATFQFTSPSATFKRRKEQQPYRTQSNNNNNNNSNKNNNNNNSQANNRQSHADGSEERELAPPPPRCEAYEQHPPPQKQQQQRQRNECTSQIQTTTTAAITTTSATATTTRRAAMISGGSIINPDAASAVDATGTGSGSGSGTGTGTGAGTGLPRSARTRTLPVSISTTGGRHHHADGVDLVGDTRTPATTTTLRDNGTRQKIRPASVSIAQQQRMGATQHTTASGHAAAAVRGAGVGGGGESVDKASATHSFVEGLETHLGLIGWRKKCLYTLLVLLMLLIITNLVLTLWILKVMEFTTDGMGQLKIVPGGIQLTGQALIMDMLRASTIRSRHGQPITIESSRNFSINTRDANGMLQNHLFLGHDKLECLSTGFRINDTAGRNLFSVNRNEVTIGAHALRVDGEGGAIFRESIQTPHVRAEPGRELRLESPTRQLEMTAARDINLQSRAGGIELSALEDVKLSALDGSLRMESSKIVMPNLRTAQSPAPGAAQSREHLHRVFQLCACSNGKLFLAAPHSICAGDDSTVCR